MGLSNFVAPINRNATATAGNDESIHTQRQAAEQARMSPRQELTAVRVESRANLPAMP
jgi:hypothetical protein